MNISEITARLKPHRIERLTAAVDKLESAIASGIVPNALFVDAKDTINRAVDEACDNYQDETHDFGGTLVMGAHNLPAAIKVATKEHATKRLSVLNSLLPLHALIQTAKPLIVKKGDMPKVRTAKQIADDADRMTCQCCGRRIFARLGSIAHHGYERPGYGWQTASCMGAKHLPFEVDRARLGDLIIALKDLLTRMIAARESLANETTPIKRQWKTGWRKDAEVHSFDFTRANFGSPDAEKALRAGGWFHHTFDALLKIELASRDSEIRSLTTDITMHQMRFDGWTQTHRWNADTKTWESI